MKNAYVEITNICNLNCSFCPGHTREKMHMSSKNFRIITKKLDGKIENLFLHIMGEPLLHPELRRIIGFADRMNVKLKITTNGTLLPLCLPILKNSQNLHTVNISLHALGGNWKGGMISQRMDKYFTDVLESAQLLAKSGKFVVLRLWNLESGEEKENVKAFNDKVISMAKKIFPPEKEEWVKTHRGERIATHVFIEWGERFKWPELSEDGEIREYDDEIGCESCHALLTQFGILADGTVVPCCLDRNGDIPLGNIFESEIEDILASPRAKAMKEAMEHHRYIEPLCATCGFKRK